MTYDGVDRRIYNPKELTVQVHRASHLLRVLAAVVAVVVTVVLAVILALSIQSQHDFQASRDRHDRENQVLHDCLVDLIMSIIRTPREALLTVVNPCLTEKGTP